MKNAELAEYRAMLIAQAALQNERSRGLGARLRHLFGPPRAPSTPPAPLALPALEGDEELAPAPLLDAIEATAAPTAEAEPEAEAVAEAVELCEPDAAVPAQDEEEDDLAFPRREFGLRPDEPLELSEPIAPAPRPVQASLPFAAPEPEPEPLLLSLEASAPPAAPRAASRRVDLMDDLLDDLDQELDAVADVLAQATGVAPDSTPVREPDVEPLPAEEPLEAVLPEVVEARPEPRLVAGADASEDIEAPAAADHDATPTGARALLLQLESALTQEWLGLERQLSQDTPAPADARPRQSGSRASPRQRRRASGRGT